MKRLSLMELKAKQAELSQKIEEAEAREKNIIGEYMQRITGEYELDGVKKWLNDHMYDKNREKKETDINLYSSS